MNSIEEITTTSFERTATALENNDIEHFRLLFSSPESVDPDMMGGILVSALELDRREIALELIQNNTSLFVANDEESTCLMIAAKKNNLECLEKILSRNQVDINATDIFGWTALMYSCYYGHPEITKSLLLAGAMTEIFDHDHMSSLIWAAGRGHTDCVNKLLQFGRAKVDQVDRCGTSALIWACRKGHTEIASLLIKAGANTNSLGMFGWSALLVAVQGNHIETVKLLLQHKPNVNTCDVQGHTPLIAASKEGRVEIVKLLLKARAFVNLTDEYGHTALIHATKGSHLDVVDLLLTNHADIDHHGTDKKTALFWAVEKGNLSIVERILQNKPNLELASKDGDSCLMRAVRLRKAGIVRILLAHQAKVSTCDKNGDTVLHMAVKLQSATLAHLILANPKNHHLLNKSNKAKQTPLMLDSANTSPVFPTILEMHHSGNKLTYKLMDINLRSSDFHLDHPNVDYSLALNERVKPSLFRKLTFGALKKQPALHRPMLA